MFFKVITEINYRTPIRKCLLAFVSTCSNTSTQHYAITYIFHVNLLILLFFKIFIQMSSANNQSTPLYNYYDRLINIPVILQSVEFHGVTITKRDALIKEVSELFKAKNL